MSGRNFNPKSNSTLIDNKQLQPLTSDSSFESNEIPVSDHIFSEITTPNPKKSKKNSYQTTLDFKTTKEIVKDFESVENKKRIQT